MLCVSIPTFDTFIVFTAQHSPVWHGELDFTSEDIVPQITVVSSLLPASSHILGGPQAVEQVIFNFDTYNAKTSFLGALGHDWFAISEQVLTLSSLRTVMFSFKLLEELERFVDSNQATLDILREPSGLVLAYKNLGSLGLAKCWLEADTQTLKPTGTGSYHD